MLYDYIFTSQAFQKQKGVFDKCHVVQAWCQSYSESFCDGLKMTCLQSAGGGYSDKCRDNVQRYMVLI